MPKKRSTGTAKRSRTRSGCVTCRDRHIKCDEQQPVCRNCIKSKRKCYRGIRLNFTQYSLYDPDENSRSRRRPPIRQEYRILDQSITIASLYDNGKRGYLPFLHLHSPEDLRESDLQFQQDIYSALPSGSTSNYGGEESTTDQPPKLVKVRTSSKVPLNVSSISENYEISNQLLNESYFKNQFIQQGQNTNQPQQFPVQDQLLYPQSIPSYFYSQPDNPVYRSVQQLPQPQIPLSDRVSGGHFGYVNTQMQPRFEYENLIQSRTIPTNVDANVYIHLIENEKYYWLLDLLNDLNIWKSIVPSICIKSAETDSFLLDCLLHCSLQNETSLDKLLHQQLEKWNSCRALYPIDAQNSIVFESLLVSVTLIMLGIYLKSIGTRLTEFQKIVLDNQLKLFNKVMVKIEEYLKSKRSKSVVLISCVHSIIMIKYFIIKIFRLDYGVRVTERTVDVTEEIIYPENSSLLSSNDPFSSHGSELSSLVGLTSFEIANLNHSFKSIDFGQLKYKSMSNDTKSDASEFRDILWYLIKLNYVITNSDLANQFGIDYNYIYKDQDDLSTSESSLSAMQDGSQFTPIRQQHTSRLPPTNNSQTACYLLREFIHKLLNMGNPDIIRDANYKIESLFQTIDGSFNDAEVKVQWRKHFDWVLRYINPNVSE
ncbi:uncharacterized protein J8A68_001756 [[Candida] subhashii]|uniref:Zn(2)-C6 fungal-type domain-containing protein n=1 Tax=[Candida] subhashii TaxID=561895 RepID=A0A8J5QHF3_9ASCO|nr:uncharacterized protein J8A68_001756 [[Candida] subhashii]KAG7664731.1 hypothetical protein J8A68_001756 [[Candida] subhashii]